MYSIMTSEENRDISPKLTWICLIGILLVAAVLRFWYLTDNPPISFFEKLHAGAARGLANGTLDFENKPWTFFSRTLFYPPLFHTFGALVFITIAKATITLRFIGGLSGILTTFAVFLIGKEIASRRTGLFSALLFALYPFAVQFNRLAIPQNLGMVWLSFAFYFLMKARNDKNTQNLYISAVLIAIASLTIYSAILFVPLLMVIALLVNKQTRKPLFLISTVPLILLFVTMLIIHFNIVLSNLGSAFTYGVTETDRPIPSFACIKGLWSFLFHDWFIFLGILGVCFYQSRYPWYLLYAILVTCLGGLAGQAAYENSLYPALTLSFPFILLGTGRMSQVIIDNVTSLFNAIFLKDTSIQRQKLSPGKVVALIGFYIIVILILYDVIPQIKVSFNTIIS
jgi:4-amino-4-deoxy-L-arabinose transferase-like glycosyltransferase